MRVCDCWLLDRVRWCEAIILSRWTWITVIFEYAVAGCHYYYYKTKNAYLHWLPNIERKKCRLTLEFVAALAIHARHACCSLLILIYYVCGWASEDHRIDSNSIKTGKTKNRIAKNATTKNTKQQRSDAVICFMFYGRGLHTPDRYPSPEIK